MSVPPAAVEAVVEHPTRNRLLAGILVLLILFACSAAAVLVVPLVIALLASLTLAPAVRMLCRWRLPRPLAAFTVMTIALALLFGVFASMVGPARSWSSRVPLVSARIAHAVSDLRAPLQAMNQAGDALAKITTGGDNGLQRVVESGPSQLGQMLSATPAVLASVVATLLLCFIFLSRGDNLLRKLVELAPELHIKKDIVLGTRSAQHELSTYMITIATINATLGALTALALWGFGVEDPWLFGGLVAVLNFMPFLGPLLAALLLIGAGFSRFEAPWAALSVPAVFLLLHFIESQLVTPLVVGRRLALDPIMVFLALMLFGWLWGFAGLLLAMPLVTCARIVAERVPAWSAFATLLSA